MRYSQRSEDDDSHLTVRTENKRYDLTTARKSLRSLTDLLSAAAITDRTIDEITDRLIGDAAVLPSPDSSGEGSVPPVLADEVWAAGVTYESSEQARKAESTMSDMYADVYTNDRPEVFFKATPSRTVGPNDAVGVRGDSEWDVPEPELGVVLYHDEIVGYTVGNDVSSRSIEGQNALYLPQAKVFDRCCAIGPCVRSAASLHDPHDLEIRMSITRDDETLYEDSTSTGEMVRSVEELVECYTRHNAVPETSVLLTGTSLVPDDGFTLREGDTIDIDIEEIGTLTNSVVTV